MINNYSSMEFLEAVDLLYSLEELQQSLSELASEITSTYQSEVPLLIGIMNGGLITLGQLLPLISRSVDVDYCHATRYGKALKGSELDWLVYPRQSLQGRDVLLVDDIYDEGVTLKLVVDYCWQQGAQSVKTLVLLDKQHNRKVDNFDVDYCGLTIEDRYVFGFGLDYKGRYRNAPGIFALKNEGQEL